jgi:hypothetical protein
MHVFTDLVAGFDPEEPHFRPTEIFNEGWLLKAVLHQASQLALPGSPIAFAEAATWFSEALLPTAFTARYQGDPLAEARTNADGVIGHILVGTAAKADLVLKPDATQFAVVEAKIGSPLSSGTTRAPGFDQAARNVACIAEVLRRSTLSPDRVEQLAFIVVAPQKAVEAGAFASEMVPGSIRRKIEERVASYKGEKDDWFYNWATPTLEAVNLHTVSWESAIEAISRERPGEGAALDEFYQECLRFN